MFFVCGFACECSANKGQGRVSDPVELKLQQVMDCWTWCWEQNSVPLEEQQRLLTAEPSLWALILYLLSYNFQIFFPIKINFYVACMCVYTVHTHCLGWKLVDHKYMCLFMCSLVCSISLFLRQYCVLRSPVLLALCFLLRIVLAIPSLWAQSKF